MSGLVIPIKVLEEFPFLDVSCKATSIHRDRCPTTSTTESIRDYTMVSAHHHHRPTLKQVRSQLVWRLDDESDR
jgi:hypothetical protein